MFQKKYDPIGDTYYGPYDDPVGNAYHRSEKNDLFDPKMQRVVNPWHTFGPVGYPPQLMTFTQRYREWLNPTVGVPPVGWAGPGVREGGNASLYRCEITFLKSYTVESLGLLVNGNRPAQESVLLAVAGQGGAPVETPTVGDA